MPLQLAGAGKSAQIVNRAGHYRTNAGSNPKYQRRMRIAYRGHPMTVGFRVFSGGAKVDIDVVTRFRNLPVANVSDAMNRMSAGGAMLRPMHAGGVLAGAAVPGKTRPGDNLTMHKGFHIAAPA